MQKKRKAFDQKGKTLNKRGKSAENLHSAGTKGHPSIRKGKPSGDAQKVQAVTSRDSSRLQPQTFRCAAVFLLQIPEISIESLDES